MAHADYDCCAVCDCKISYNECSETKDRLCTRCAVELAKRGIFATSPDELLKLLIAEPAKVLQAMMEVGYSPCFYGNEFDMKVKMVHAQQQQPPASGGGGQ